MRRKREEKEESEEIEEVEELTEKELKKKKVQDSALKRKNAKKKDKVARWGGIILLGLMMFVGFLLWVSSQMQQGPSVTPSPVFEQESIIVR